MKIYLAAAFERREEMREIRHRLESFGYVVTSRWIDLDDDVKPIGAEDLRVDAGQYTNFALMDLGDVYNADTVIMFSGGGRGGRHTEFGYAIALDKQLIIVGERENVFHSLPGVMCFSTVDKLYHRAALGVTVIPS